MADSFNKKEREKKRQKRKKDKALRKKQKKEEGVTGEEFMYLDGDGNLVAEKPDPALKRKYKAEDMEISTPKKDDSDEGNKFERKGIVKFFNYEKGYGFIADRDTHESFFVHADSLVDEIRDNDKVAFEVGNGPKGPVALNVKIVS